MAEAAAEARREHRFDVIATLVLACATVATAWAGYQASRWQGEQARAFAKASATRIEAARASGLANRQIQIDVSTFIAFVDAFYEGDAERREFYRKRFRPEFKPAVDAWEATRPLVNEDAPLTPFAMPEYKLAAQAEAERLDAQAAAKSAEASVDIDRATRYVFCVVLFAGSLFLAGIASRQRTLSARRMVLVLGCALFLGALAWLATFPISFAT